MLLSLPCTGSLLILTSSETGWAVHCALRPCGSSDLRASIRSICTPSRGAMQQSCCMPTLGSDCRKPILSQGMKTNTKKVCMSCAHFFPRANMTGLLPLPNKTISFKSRKGRFLTENALFAIFFGCFTSAHSSSTDTTPSVACTHCSKSLILHLL